jgi:hypothetical protein
VRRLFGWTAGLVSIAALARLLAARRHRADAPVLPPPALPAEDPAEELRRKLAESRDMGASAAEPTEPKESLEERRARVHAKAQEALSAMDELQGPA